MVPHDRLNPVLGEIGEAEGVTPPVEEVGRMSAQEGQQIFGYPEHDRLVNPPGPLRALEIEVSENGMGGAVAGRGTLQSADEDGAGRVGRLSDDFGQQVVGPWRHLDGV